MGTELRLSDLDHGPHDGPQARRHGITNAPPNPRQTKLRCNRCFLYLTSVGTPKVVKGNPVQFVPKWNCGSQAIASSADPCSACPICSRDDGLTRRRLHLCEGMVNHHVYAATLLPCNTMLDYGRCGDGCTHCGFSLSHIVCECP